LAGNFNPTVAVHQHEKLCGFRHCRRLVLSRMTLGKAY
jgi:hypothetical protein